MSTNWTENLEKIRKSIKAGEYTSEAAVSRGIIMRLLDMLEWDVYDTQAVYPEFPLDSRKVDYALCYPAGKPEVILEVKALGKVSGADDQLFDYAFKAGVPIAILTDGQEWSFYYPSGKGTISERRFYKIDIMEREINEIQTQMEIYLKYDNICSGKAAKNAKDAYENSFNKARSKEFIPEAFKKLVDDSNETLIDLISEKVADLCGIKPNIEDIINYLKSPLIVPPIRTKPLIGPTLDPPNLSQKNRIGFYLNGSFFTAKTGKDAIIGLFNKLDEIYPGFHQNFENDPSNYGRKNKYISRDRNEIYPDDPVRIRDSTVQLKSGFWIGINTSSGVKETQARGAAKFLNLAYDTDIYINCG